jgi:F-type H+-transporting ATPase subunit c
MIAMVSIGITAGVTTGADMGPALSEGKAVATALTSLAQHSRAWSRTLFSLWR